MSVVDVAINRDSGFGVGPIRRKGRSGRRSSGSHTKQQFSPTPEANTTSNYMAGHPSLSYFPGTFAHPGLLAPAFTPRDEPPPPPPLYPSTTTRSSYTTSLANRDSCLSQTVCPQQTQSTQTTDAPSMETHYIPSRILSPIPTMRRSSTPNDPINPILARPPSPPRSRRRTTSPLAPESHHRQRPNRPRFPRSKIEPSLLRVALMTQLIKRCKASDEYDTIPLKGGAGGVVIMQKLSRSRPISAVPKYSERPATPSGIVGC